MMDIGIVILFSFFVFTFLKNIFSFFFFARFFGKKEWLVFFGAMMVAPHLVKLPRPFKMMSNAGR